MNKLLLAIFTILLVFVLGELSYILVLGGKENPPPPPATKTQQTTDSLILFPHHAVDVNGLSMLTYWQKGVVNSVNVTVELKGKIVEIDTNGQVQEHGWPTYDYALKIKIQGENNETNDIFLSQEELQKSIFKKVGTQNTTEPITYSDLKINDNIQVSFIFDLTKGFGDNFVSCEVTKL